jgi:hypothetical protein
MKYKTNNKFWWQILTFVVLCFAGNTQVFSQRIEKINVEGLPIKSSRLYEYQKKLFTFQENNQNDDVEYQRAETLVDVADSAVTRVDAIQSLLIVYNETCNLDGGKARQIVSLQLDLYARILQVELERVDRVIARTSRAALVTYGTGIKDEVKEIISLFESINKNHFAAKLSTSGSKTESDTSSQRTSKSNRSNNSPFVARYVGGNRPPEVEIINDADRTLNLNLGGKQYVITSKTNQKITLEPGTYNFKATVPRTIPLKGSENFERGYVYSWTFYIVRQ